MPASAARSGVRNTSVGRIASCAPWASALDLKKFGFSGQNSAPKLCVTKSLAAARACSEMLTESVRM